MRKKILWLCVANEIDRLESTLLGIFSTGGSGEYASISTMPHCPSDNVVIEHVKTSVTSPMALFILPWQRNFQLSHRNNYGTSTQMKPTLWGFVGVNGKRLKEKCDYGNGGVEDGEEEIREAKKNFCGQIRDCVLLMLRGIFDHKGSPVTVTVKSALRAELLAH
uniref:RNase III domain-containing protein n=1 Tax=Ascaris lumbricoides TaxID=6252 RepID=A0A0M3HY05_ASCLU